MTVAATRRVATLIDDCYAAALDDSLWTGMAGRLASALGSTSGVIKSHGRDGDVEFTDVTANLEVSPRDADWAEHWHRNDLWVERSIQLGPSRVVTSDELVSSREFEASGFYQDWTRRLEIYHMIGAVFDAGNGATFVLGLHRDKGGRCYGANDRQQFAAILPHLRRAWQLRSALSAARLAASASLEGLRLAGDAVVVTDAAQRVVYASPSAESYLKGRDGICVHRGRLSTTGTREQARLQRALSSVATPGKTETVMPPAAVVVQRAGRLPLLLWACPLVPPPGTPGSPPRCALVVLKDPERKRPDSATGRLALQAAFELTPRECDIALALARGDSLEAIARTLSLSLGYVRQRLKVIFAKTRTARQAEVVAVVNRLL